jgi:hypothetical protein
MPESTRVRENLVRVDAGLNGHSLGADLNEEFRIRPEAGFSEVDSENPPQ